MTLTTPNLDEMTVQMDREICIQANLANSFDALVEQIGAEHTAPDGAPMPMTLESWPGGRWFRDLGDDNGHHWGHVQAIKRPTLLEISGPLFMSYAVAANVQYRLTEAADGTLLTMRFSALGLIPDEHRQGMEGGWMHLMHQVKTAAEGKSR